MNSRTITHPVLVDRSLNRALAIKYGIYSLFGLVGAIINVPAIRELSAVSIGPAFELFWTLSVFITAAIAARYAWSGTHERQEMLATGAMFGFVSGYATSIFLLAFQGDDNRLAGAIIASALLVIPWWRMTFLFGKLRKRKPGKS